MFLFKKIYYRRCIKKIKNLREIFLRGFLSFLLYLLNNILYFYSLNLYILDLSLFDLIKRF